MDKAYLFSCGSEVTFEGRLSCSVLDAVVGHDGDGSEDGDDDDDDEEFDDGESRVDLSGRKRGIL